MQGSLGYYKSFNAHSLYSKQVFVSHKHINMVTIYAKNHESSIFHIYQEEVKINIR